MITSIYFIGNRDCGFIKIGVTDGPVIKRLCALQVGNPYKLFCYGIIRFESSGAAYREERRIHAIFSDYRMRGEWFYFTADIRGFIDDVLQDSENVQYAEGMTCPITEDIVRNKISACDSRYAAVIAEYGMTR